MRTGIKRTTRQALCHLKTRSGLAWLTALVRRAQGHNVDHLLLESLADRFSAIYDNRIWLNGRESGSRSGLGSEIANTQSIRLELPEMLASLATGVLLDIGCGDFTWMKELDLPCRYIGIDIVPSVIVANSARYSSESRRFAVLDATREALPLADTVLCREILFHLSFKDIWRVIANVQACGASFLIATNDDGLKLNADIISGDFRPLNLRRDPFQFPRPTRTIHDNSQASDRVLAVWELSEFSFSGRENRQEHSHWPGPTHDSGWKNK
jgi:hypothetical protein